MMDKRTQEQLTAYALGEFDAVDVGEVEAILAENARARQFVNEMHRLGDLAGEAYGSDGLGEERRLAILAEAKPALETGWRDFWNAPSKTRLVVLAASAALVIGLGYATMALIEDVEDSGVTHSAAFSNSVADDKADLMTLSLRESQLRRRSEARANESAGESSARRSVRPFFQTELYNDPTSAVDGEHVGIDSSGFSGIDPSGGALFDGGGDLASAAPANGATQPLPDRYYAGRGGRGFVGGGIGAAGRAGGGGAGGFGGGGRGGRGGGGGLGARSGGARVSNLSELFRNADDSKAPGQITLGIDVDTDELRTQLESLGYAGDPNQTLAGLPDGRVLNGPWGVPGQAGQAADTPSLNYEAERLARVDHFAVLTPQQQQARTEHNTEAYDRVVDNPFKRAIDEPLSTFSIDVDTGSYANVRRFLRNAQLPPKDAVRIEELLNYFDYEYAPPANADPFAAHVELVQCPWNDANRLMRIGLKGREVEVHTRPAANLVFLLDVSGSMQPENKLPLVRDAMQLLTKQLRPDDRVAIVTYAGNSGLVLPSTLGTEQETILSAIARLESGGSTNGAAGIELAYQVAQDHFFDGGVNRVILATDGDFNVGVTDRGSLDRLIEEKAKSGVFLTVLGVGEGNLKDATMEQLADKGNGQYAYLDSEREARKVLVEQVGGTLVTIAKDVKIQIDFNPMVIGEYRLIGYENRVLAAQDFDDDTKDAGEIGAGHAVTALYEITPPTMTDYPEVSGTQSRYVTRVPAGADTMTTLSDGTEVPQLLTVKLRYKEPDGDTSTLLEIPLTAEAKPMVDASRDTRFAASVAAFGMALRESPYRGTVNWDLIANLAEDGLGEDAQGYRKEFMELIRTARGLKPAIELPATAASGTSSGDLILVAIRKFSGGTYVAEFREGDAEPQRFGVGEGPESLKVVSIDPVAQRVVVYSEAHRMEFTLTPAE